MKISARSPGVRLGALLLLALLALAGPALAQWQWRDKNNQLHASDLPPPADVPEKDIVRRPAGAKAAAPPAAASAASADAPALPASANNKLEAEADARRAKAEQEEKAKKKAAEEANAAARVDNCARAKRQMAAIDSGVRLTRVNDKGEREYLDDRGRAEEAQRTRGIIASDCK